MRVFNIGKKASGMYRGALYIEKNRYFIPSKREPARSAGKGKGKLLIIIAIRKGYRWGFSPGGWSRAQGDLMEKKFCGELSCRLEEERGKEDKEGHSFHPPHGNPLGHVINPFPS